MTIGFSSASTLYEGQTRTGAFDREPHDVAAIAYLYPAILQIAATQESGAAGIADLAEDRLSIGPPGSNSAVPATRMLTGHHAFDRPRAARGAGTAA